MIKKILTLFVYCSILFSYSETEKIFYNVKYNGIRAGEAILEKRTDDNLVNISLSLKSRKLFDFIYKLRENILIKADKLGYHIYEIKKTSRQGKYKKKFNAIFDYKKNIGYLENMNININEKIYDPISIIYHLRNNELVIDKIFNYSIISKNKPKKITITVLGEEEITMNNTQYSCFVLGTDESSNKSGFLKLWISQEAGHMPIIIEQKARNGVIKMELKKYTLLADE